MTRPLRLPSCRPSIVRSNDGLRSRTANRLPRRIRKICRSMPKLLLAADNPPRRADWQGARLPHNIAPHQHFAEGRIASNFKKGEGG